MSDSNLKIDQIWMKRAFAMAQQAAAVGEVPVGALLVKGDEQIAGGRNAMIGLNDPTAHAEIQVLRAAGGLLGNYRFPGTTLYVTLEPCLMCMGAMLHARIDRLVFSAYDPKTGAAGSLYSLADDPNLNHSIDVCGGVLEAEGSELLRAFFRKRRKERKNKRVFAVVEQVAE